FFFSSRRRHTRSDRDWSSDVCSSDLDARPRDPRRLLVPAAGRLLLAHAAARLPALAHRLLPGPPLEDRRRLAAVARAHPRRGARSEERRVGKEWRVRRWRDAAKEICG